MGKSYFFIGVSIANSMVGSSMILFPLIFKDKGVLINTLCVFFSASIMSFTCKLLVDQIKPGQKDVVQVIYRKMGPNHGRLFGALSSILLFLVSSVFFLLAIDVLFDCFDQLFDSMSISQTNFKLIFVGIFALLNYLKDLKYVFKAAPLAMSALVISTITLIISVGFNTDNINSQFLDIKPISAKDFLQLSSIIGFAFICHPTIGPIVDENENKEENDKAVYFGYGITIILYVIVGILGSLAIYGKHPTKSSNIIDYFSGQFQSPLIGILTFLYLFMISPIFPFVSKNQALQLIPKQKRQKINHLFLKSSIVYSIFWIPLNVVFIITQTAPSKVIGFISTVVCFYITYFLPIIMTIKTNDYIYQNTSTSLSDSLIVAQQNEKRPKNQTFESFIIENNEKNEKVVNKFQSNFKQTALWKKILYIGILLYGLGMFIFELVSFFFPSL